MALSYASTLSPSHLALGMYWQQQYSVPFSAESSFLLCHRGLLKPVSILIEPPKTMAEIAAAAKITAPGGVKGEISPVPAVLQHFTMDAACLGLVVTAVAGRHSHETVRDHGLAQHAVDVPPHVEGRCPAA